MSSELSTAEELSAPDDDLAPDDDSEDDPVPIYPIYPPPFPPPCGDDEQGDSMGYAVFSIALGMEIKQDAVQGVLSAEYVSVNPLMLPLTRETQTQGDFKIIVCADPGQSDGNNYLVTVFGDVGTTAGDFILLVLNLPSPSGKQAGQFGVSLGKLVTLPEQA